MKYFVKRNRQEKRNKNEKVENKMKKGKIRKKRK